MISFIAKNVASYGITKGLDALLKQDKETFVDRLKKTIDDTIDEYMEKFPQEETERKFPFYKSQIIIEEFLKFRLFEKNGYTLSEDNIIRALEKNPNIIKPNKEQIKAFFKIFDKHLNADPLLKRLEIEEFHEEKIYKVYDKVEEILSYLKTHLVEVVSLLEEEYKQEITDCYDDLKNLKPKSALQRLKKLEIRIKENSIHVKNKIKANLEFIKGLCYEGLGNMQSSYECFIQAHLINPENTEYYGRACMSYYLLKENTYKELLDKIREHEPYNPTLWALEAICSDDIIGFIDKKVPEIVKKKNRFLRLVFSHSANNNPEIFNKLSLYIVATDLPEVINYDNIHYWVFIFNVASHNYFYGLNIPFKGFIEEKKEALYLLQLGKKLTRAIEHSELYNEYFKIVFFTYWLECEIEKQPDTLIHLEETYKKLNKKDSFITFLFANTTQKFGNKEKAIKIINSFEGRVNNLLISLKTFCLIETPNLIKLDLVKEYFQTIKIITNENILNTCNFIIPILTFNIIDSADLSKLIERAKYSNISYKKLLLAIIDSYNGKSNDFSVELINELIREFNTESGLNFFLALILFNTKHYKECVSFIKTYLDETKETRDLALLINALYNDKESDQIELLRLLKLWREKYTFNDNYLRNEIELRQIIHEWEEILAISKYGLTKKPQDDGFYSSYILSLFQLEKKDVLDRELSKLLNFPFTNTNNALLLSKQLIYNGYKKEGLELLYKMAVNKTENDARMHYFMISSLPEFEKYFQELDAVSKGTYVKLEINGEQQVFFIDNNVISQPLLNKSLGKHKGDVFLIEENVGSGHKQVKVLKIMNKYLALVTEIIDEMSSPFTNLKVKPVKFESEDIEAFKETLINNFGIEQMQITKHREKLFQDYYSYKLFFTQLVISVFDNNYIDTYNYLTSKQSKGFYVLPLKYQTKDIEIDSKKIVIDFTSGILFYELATKFNINFTNLIVPDSFYYMLEMVINKANEEKRSQLRVIINEKDVIPINYPEDYHTNRINYLNSLKKWFQSNTNHILPKERIGLLRALKDYDNIPNSFEYFIDTSLLAQRKGYVLISDDLFYAYNRGLKVVSTEKYLNIFFIDLKEDIYEHLLTKKYIGLTVDKKILYSAYINKAMNGKELNYNYALRNIGLKENMIEANVKTVVGFLKKLALNQAVSSEQYFIDATNIFAVLLPNIVSDKNLYLILTNKIRSNFHLLGDYLENTLQALYNATKIITTN